MKKRIAHIPLMNRVGAEFVLLLLLLDMKDKEG